MRGRGHPADELSQGLEALRSDSQGLAVSKLRQVGGQPGLFRRLFHVKHRLESVR